MRITVKFCILIYILAIFSKTFAAPVSMTEKESDQGFVERVTTRKVLDDSRGHIQLLRSSKLLKKSEVLIAFAKVPNENDFDIHMNAFIRKSGANYESLTSKEVCEVEGGDATLESFFYVDLKTESRPLIAVICSWPEHRYADCQLKNEVRFFRVTEKSIDIVSMEPYQKLLYEDEKPYAGREISDGKCSHAKFKTANDVKKLLAENLKSSKK